MSVLPRLPSEDEKVMLRNKLAEIAKLEEMKHELLEEKKKVKQETVPLKSRLHCELKEGVRR
jgi:hypothetical protein